MTSPRSAYGGGYYSAPSFPDTPIYDSLVAERGTPQIAPIRVPAAYDSAPSSGYQSGGPSSHLPALASSLPALPAALPALPAAPVHAQQAPGGYGYPYQQQAPQPMALQQAPAPYIPQQQAPARGYVPQPQAPSQPQPMPQPMRPVAAGGYEAMRPATPRPVQAPVQIQVPVPSFEDPYGGRQYQGGRGY
ncbi:DUF6643 family protein [Streptomyces sp. NPDC048603]|uniref:DUF6643 family protein n=1 Tax=Streptomyces sp. NPDC048603 TaxID=3365577 RepID=UPI00371CEDA6